MTSSSTTSTNLSDVRQKLHAMQSKRQNLLATMQSINENYKSRHTTENSSQTADEEKKDEDFESIMLEPSNITRESLELQKYIRQNGILTNENEKLKAALQQQTEGGLKCSSENGNSGPSTEEYNRVRDENVRLSMEIENARRELEAARRETLSVAMKLVESKVKVDELQDHLMVLQQNQKQCNPRSESGGKMTRPRLRTNAVAKIPPKEAFLKSEQNVPEEFSVDTSVDTTVSEISSYGVEEKGHGIGRGAFRKMFFTALKELY